MPRCSEAPPPPWRATTLIAKNQKWMMRSSGQCEHNRTRINTDVYRSFRTDSVLLSGESVALRTRFLPRTIAASVHVHEHDHVNAHELRPRLTLGVDVDIVVDVVVDVHVDVIGSFIWLRLRRPRSIRRIDVNSCPVFITEDTFY